MQLLLRSHTWRCVYPSEYAVLNAMARLDTKSGTETNEITAENDPLQLAEDNELLARPERFELPTYCSGGLAAR